jgi:hypothetical protein
MSPVTYVILGLAFGAILGFLLGIAVVVLLLYVSFYIFPALNFRDEPWQSLVLAWPVISSVLGAALSGLFFYRVGKREEARSFRG